MSQAVTSEELLERYKRGVVRLDDVTDYFYKRLYPRRYHLLKMLPQYQRLWRGGPNASTWKRLVGQFPAFIVAWSLLPFFALHYRNTTARLADNLRANRQPDLPRSPRN